MPPAPAARMFEPGVLQWARKQMRMTEAVVSGKLAAHWKDITPEVVKRWESGTASPTTAQVKRLAEVYKRPLAVFLLPAPPGEGDPLPPDRRTLGSRARGPFTTNALIAVRRARRIQTIAADLQRELGAGSPFKYERFLLDADPNALARRIRSDLAVSTRAQFGFRRYSEFFEYLRERIESAGVVTLRTGGHNSFPTTDARALSFADRQPYVILVNNADREGAKNFSLLHELGHILLRQAGLCDNFSAFASNARHVDPVEVFCNQFAASFLVPDEDFVDHAGLRGRKRIAPADLKAVAEPLALAFKVSRLVILRKLLTLGFIESRTYKETAALWEDEPRPKRTGGRSLPAKTAVLSNGRTYSQLVFEAYRARRLSTAAVSDYLGVRAKHIPAIEKLITT